MCRTEYTPDSLESQEEVSHRPMPEVSWDPQSDFLAEYRRLMEKVKAGDRNAYAQIQFLRVKEYHNTIGLVRQGFYVTERGHRYTFPSDREMVQGTVYYKDEMRVDDICLATAPVAPATTAVEVVNADCLAVAMRLQEEGYNPAVLNMADRGRPGGGVTSGAGAQEDGLFRRTNLFRSLYQFVAYAEHYGVPPSADRYPLDSNFGGIYTPGALCFREGEDKGYALLEHPARLSFIAVAGINRPRLTSDGMIVEAQAACVRHKIRTILRIGLRHGHDALVLGALGCGAFRNPPRHVARLFHEVMDEAEFAGKYRRIAFAILDDHNAHRSHNPEGNYRPFAEEFAGARER